MANATITEVAKLAGVSTATVSRCLNAPEKVGKRTLTRVMKVIEETNFSPNFLAQSFRRGKTNIVLVVVHGLGNWLFSSIIDGIRLALGERYSIILTEARQGLPVGNSFIDMLVAKQVEGVILLCSPLPFSRKLIEINKSRQLPVVIGLEPVEDDLRSFPSVHIDNFQAAYEATAYLTGLGHKQIAFVSGPRNSYATRDREEGFRAAMKDSNLVLDDNSVFYSDLSVNGGVNTAADIFALAARPTAVFCANDDMAIGVMSAASRQGISVPGQLSVVGFDDTCYAETSTPSLTTVAQPGREIGIRAAERLLQAIETSNGEGRLTEVLPHKLVVRQSTRALS